MPTIGQIFNAFTTAEPRFFPALVFPFLFVGKAGATVTGVSDGTSIMLWVAGKHGHFHEWWQGGSPDGFTPGKWKRLYMEGASYPLLQVPARSRSTAPVPMEVFGRIALLPVRHVRSLNRLEACYIGPSTVQPPDAHHVAVSLRATAQGVLIRGVIICEDAPDYSQKAKPKATPAQP